MVSFAMPLGTALFSSLAIWSLSLAWGSLPSLGFTHPPLNNQIKIHRLVDFFTFFLGEPPAQQWVDGYKRALKAGFFLDR